MKTAQKICMLLLLWSLPISMLPHTIAKPRATAPGKSPNEAQLKLNATENYGKLPLSFEANVGQSAEPVQFLSRGFSGHDRYHSVHFWKSRLEADCWRLEWRWL